MTKSQANLKDLHSLISQAVCMADLLNHHLTDDLTKIENELEIELENSTLESSEIVDISVFEVGQVLPVRIDSSSFPDLPKIPYCKILSIQKKDSGFDMNLSFGDRIIKLSDVKTYNQDTYDIL